MVLRGRRRLGRVGPQRASDPASECGAAAHLAVSAPKHGYPRESNLAGEADLRLARLAQTHRQFFGDEAIDGPFAARWQSPGRADGAGTDRP